MTVLIVSVFLLVYLGMLLGGLPFLQLDRTGVVLLGAMTLIASEAVPLETVWQAPPCSVMTWCVERWRRRWLTSVCTGVSTLFHICSVWRVRPISARQQPHAGEQVNTRATSHPAIGEVSAKTAHLMLDAV